MPLDITRQQLLRNGALGEQVPLWKWSVEFESLPPEVNSVYDRDKFNLLCQSVMPPRREAGENIEISIRGFKVQIPGIYSDSMTMEFTFIEDADNTIASFLNGYQEAMWNFSTGASSIGDIVTNIIVTRHKFDNSDVWFYKAFDAWFMENDPVGQELGSDTSDIVRPTATMYYSYFTQGATLGELDRNE